MLIQPLNFPLPMWTTVLDIKQGMFSHMHVSSYHVGGEHFFSVGPRCRLMRGQLMSPPLWCC